MLAVYAPAGGPVDHLTAVVGSLQAGLDLPGETRINVVVAERNEKLVSVQRSPEDDHLFILSFDSQFLPLLEEDEVKAAIAHELGHVWIFTHHPFLHTETLANRQALRLVPRANLERVYRKMFEFRGESVDMEAFLGQ